LKQPPKISKSKRQRPTAKPRDPGGTRGSVDAPASGRNWLFRLVALVVIPLVLLVGIEAGLRLTGYGYDPGAFKKITIGNGEFFVNNETFGLRFFPPQLTRGMGPIRMPVHKPAGTYRIFILGESAAMGDPEPAYGAGRYLEALLGARYPGTHFEIINTGVTAINSHVILPIARDCANAGGDLWIIYMGNNEMVGPFGAATVFGEKAPPLGFVRLNLAIQKSRVGQLLVELGRKLKGGNAAAPSWGGMEMFVGNQLPAADPRKDVVYHNFSRNLDDIVKAGLNSGAKILLNTVAVNLKDCAPFDSLGNSNLPPAERAQFDQYFTNGVQAQEQEYFAGAVRDFGSAATLDPQVAELQFRWGQSLLRLTNYAAAREHLQMACDDDALPFRTDSRLNALIAATGRKLANDNLVLFDAAAVLATNMPSGLLGDETFYEHVHFNLDGNYRLGRAWAEQVAEMLPGEITRAAATNRWASQSACDLRLGLSDWNRELILKNMIDRLKQPPLSGQLDNAARVKNLEARVKELRSRMNAPDVAHAEADFQAALQRTPDDYFLRENYAVFLQSSTGNLPQATAQWRQIHDLLPQDYLACFELGRMLELQGQWAEAETSFRRAVALRPTLTEGWFGLGKVLASQEKFADALASFATAQKQRPQDPQVYFRSGQALAKLNRHAEAMEKYRTAAKLNPADWEPHFELGGELDAANQLDAARNEFGEAARLNPNNSRTHFNYGVLLAKEGRLDEAQYEFKETIRLEPDYEKAQTYLAELQSMKRRTP
jgi:tetratricopeptide (TPR) repeat protein